VCNSSIRSLFLSLPAVDRTFRRDSPRPEPACNPISPPLLFHGGVVCSAVFADNEHPACALRALGDPPLKATFFKFASVRLQQELFADPDRTHWSVSLQFSASLRPESHRVALHHPRTCFEPTMQRSRPISYVLANEEDYEGNVIFNVAVFLEQLVWQSFCPLLAPFAVMIRGKNWAINSGHLPRSFKLADVVAYLPQLLFPRALTFYSVIYILISSSGSASFRYTFVDLVHLGFCFAFWNTAIAIRYAYMHPVAYSRYFTHILTQDEIFTSLIVATWENLKPDVVERETTSFMNECSDNLDDSIVHATFEFTEPTLALIASSFCDDAKDMLLGADGSTDSRVATSTGYAFVKATRFAKSIMLQSNHLASKSCGGTGCTGPLPSVKYPFIVRFLYTFLIATSGIFIRVAVGQSPLGSTPADAAAIIVMALATFIGSTPVVWFSFTNIMHHIRLNIALNMLTRMINENVRVDGIGSTSLHATTMKNSSGDIAFEMVPRMIDENARLNVIGSKTLHATTIQNSSCAFPLPTPDDSDSLTHRPLIQLPPLEIMESVHEERSGADAQFENRRPLGTMERTGGSVPTVHLVKLNTIANISAFLMCRHVLRCFGRRFQARLIANCSVQFPNLFSGATLQAAF
jgi:hypothetical protein